jgi:hypothetical protein
MPQLFTKKCSVCQAELAGYGLEHLKRNEEAHMASHGMVPQEDKAPEPERELKPGMTTEGDVMEDLESELAAEPESEPEEKPKKKDRKKKKRG